MKILSREFSLKEKILILVLVLILLALAYYQFVDQPIRQALAAAEAEEQSLTTELTAVEAKLEKMRRMREELDAIIGKATEMGSYNNSKAELALLNDYLADTVKYNISFANVSRDGDQIRRNFSLQFTASDYDTVERVISRLATCPLRCQVSEMRCSIARSWYRNGEVFAFYYGYYDYTDAELVYTYTVSITATFFETMVGGTADQGLPQSSAAAN